VFYSFNYLGYERSIPEFLKKIKPILMKNGKFCFHIYHNLINTKTNANIIEDEKEVKKVFKGAGLKVYYKKVKKLFSQHIFIYGAK
jgi:cyclopropane fatty-acyl-phospholipid synthase-like methyltransferase